MSRKTLLLIAGLGVALTVLVDRVERTISDISGMESGSGEYYTEQLDWTLDGTDVSIIDAQTSNGEISLVGSDQGQVIVHAFKKVRARDEGDAAEFARQIQVYVERNGNEIRIYKKHPKPPKGVNVAVGYEIQCPSTVDVKLRTSNGKIGMEGIDGAVDAETSNGRIDLQGGAGNVNLRTSNGRIELRGATGRIHARTSNGPIVASLGMLKHEAVFSTSNGTIDVKLDAGVPSLTATTSNGGINVTLPADFSGQLDAQTSNGRVHSDFPILMRVTGKVPKNRIFGQIGEGGETTVRLRTSNGSIHLRK